MANCARQEAEVTRLIDEKIREVVSDLSNLSYETALKRSKGLNVELFDGNQVILVRENFYERGGRPEIGQSKTNRAKAIQDKINKDNKIQDNMDFDLRDEILNEENLTEREQEIQDSFNYEMDDMPSVTSVDEYDEFDYDNILSHKLNLKAELEAQRNLLKNKNNTKEDLIQLEQINDLVKRLYSDIKSLQEGGESLKNYLESAERDIENVERLLSNPTFDNMEAVMKYLPLLKYFTDSSPEGFLQMPLSELKTEEREVWDKLSVIHGKIAHIETDYEVKILAATKNAIKHHLEQLDKYADWNETQLQAEVERLYQNQFEELFLDRSWEKSQGTMLDNQEEHNVLMSVIYKIYADAMAMNNSNKEKKEELSNMIPIVEKELIKLGKVRGSGLRKVADQSIFRRKSTTSHQLIGKFSEKYENFKKSARNTQEKMSRILYKNNKTEQDYRALQDQFEDLKRNVDFIDVTRIPEILENSEFNDFSDTFLSMQEAQDYKKELISRIGEREYNKIVNEQVQNIYSYQISKESKEARLRERYNLDPGTDLEGNIPQKEMDYHLNYLRMRSPFVFSTQFRKEGNNTIEKYITNGGQQVHSGYMPMDMEFNSFIPKLDEHFDPDFKEIEDNPILNKTWGLMADLVEFNNTNGFNRDPDNLTDYSLTSQAKKVSLFSLKHLHLIPKRVLRNIHENLTTTRFKNPNQIFDVGGQSMTVDQQIERVYQERIRRFQNPTPAQEKLTREEAAEMVMSKQDPDLISNILSTTDLTEAFKAKREIETKVKFLQNQFAKTNRTNYKNLLNFFIEKQFYQINNRQNFNNLGQRFNLSDKNMTKWSRFYTDNEKEVRSAAKESKKILEQLIKEETNPFKVAEMQKEIDAIDRTLDQGGQVVTGGSFLEAVFLKMSRVAVFSVNVYAQLKNILIANTNFKEVEGRDGFYGAGAGHAASSFVAKHKFLTNSAATKQQLRVGELLLRRYELFQSSGNDIFKITESKTRSSIKAVMENPMNFVSETEKTIQRPQIFALMSEIYITGKDGTKVRMFDPKTRTFPAFIEDPNTGALKLESNFDTPSNKETFIQNTSQEYANLFGDSGRVPQALAYMNGDYRNSRVYLYEKSFLGAMAMIYKSWAVMEIQKRFGASKRLSENQHVGLGVQATILRAGVFSFAIGSVAGPFALAALGTAYALHHGYKGVSNMKKDRQNLGDALKTLITLKNTPIRKEFENAIRLQIAIAAQALGKITDLFTKHQLIDSDTIARIIGTNSKKRDGSDFTTKEIKEIKEDIQLLTNSIATGIMYLIGRTLVAAMLHPDDDEEEAFKESVDEGAKFWERVYKHPSTMAYYGLENLFSSMIEDINLTVNTDGLVRTDNLLGLKNTWDLLEATSKALDGDPTLKSGKNEGRYRVQVQLEKLFLPSVTKDGFGLGFGRSTQEDYDKDNYIDKKFGTISDKVKAINKARKEAYAARKKEFENDPGYAGYSTEDRNRIFTKELQKEFPVIKKEHINEDGSLDEGYRGYWEAYWDE